MHVQRKQSVAAAAAAARDATRAGGVFSAAATVRFLRLKSPVSQRVDAKNVFGVKEKQ